MKTNWQTKKLGEVCEIITGGTPKTSVKDFYGNEFLWAGPSDLDQGIFVTNTNKKLSKKGFRESGIRLIPKDSVLLSCIGNIGKIGIAVEEMATNQQINTFVPNQKVLDSKYLYYTLIIKTEEFKFASSQTTLPIINKTKCSNIEIPLPTLSEQKKIVKVLDEKIAKLNEAKQLREQALADTEKILSQTLNEIFEDGKKKGWEEKILADVAPIRRENNKKLLPYVGMEDIESNSGKFVGLFESKKVKSNTFYFDQNCVLYGRLRPYLNKVLVPDFEGHCSTEMFPLVPNQNILMRKYLWYWITQKSFIDEAMKTSMGSRMPRADMKKVIQFKILLPLLSEQKEIVRKLDTLSEKLQTLKELQKSQLEDFKKLEKSYLREAFNGELV